MEYDTSQLKKFHFTFVCYVITQKSNTYVKFFKKTLYLDKEGAFPQTPKQGHNIQKKFISLGNKLLITTWVVWPILLQFYTPSQNFYTPTLKNYTPKLWLILAFLFCDDFQVVISLCQNRLFHYLLNVGHQTLIIQGSLSLSFHK